MSLRYYTSPAVGECLNAQMHRWRLKDEAFDVTIDGASVEAGVVRKERCGVCGAERLYAPQGQGYDSE